MFIYLFLYLTVMLLFLDSIYTKRVNLIIFYGLIISLGIISGSRVNTLGGYDTEVYNIIYQNTPNSFREAYFSQTFLVVGIERGYIFVNSLFKQLGFTFNEFLLIIGVISSTLIGLLFRKYSKYVFFTILIFLTKGYLYYFFTAQRQVLAMAICWLSLEFIVKRKLIPFILLVLIASQFHSSALFFIIVYPLYLIKLTKKKIIIFYIASISIGVLKIGALLSVFIGGYLQQDSSEKLNNYVNKSDQGVNPLNFIELIPIIFVIVKYSEVLKKNVKYYDILIILFFLYTGLTFAFYDFIFIARLKGYFIIGYVILVSYIPFLFKTKIKYGIILLMILYFLLVFVRELLTFGDGTGYIPYKAFWY